MADINPLVRIPSLIIDGSETLFDSAAILDYLDELAGPGARSRSTDRGKILRRVQCIDDTAISISYREITAPFNSRIPVRIP